MTQMVKVRIYREGADLPFAVIEIPAESWDSPASRPAFQRRLERDIDAAFKQEPTRFGHRRHPWKDNCR